MRTVMMTNGHRESFKCRDCDPYVSQFVVVPIIRRHCDDLATLTKRFKFLAGHTECFDGRGPSLAGRERASKRHDPVSHETVGCPEATDPGQLGLPECKGRLFDRGGAHYQGGRRVHLLEHVK